MKLYSLSNTEAAQTCRQLINLSDGCASIQWSKTIRDIPEDVLESLETVNAFAVGRLESLCAEGKLVLELDEGQESLWHRAARSSDTMRRILGSCVVLSGEEAREVQESLQGLQELRFITEELSAGQSLVLL